MGKMIALELCIDDCGKKGSAASKGGSVVLGAEVKAREGRETTRRWYRV